MLQEFGLYVELMPCVCRLFEAAGLYAGGCLQLQEGARVMMALHRSKQPAPKDATYSGIPAPFPYVARVAAPAAAALRKGQKASAVEEEQDGMAVSAAVEL